MNKRLISQDISKTFNYVLDNVNQDSGMKSCEDIGYKVWKALFSTRRIIGVIRNPIEWEIRSNIDT